MIDAMVREEACGRLERARVALMRIIDDLNIVDVDKCMATAELDAALLQWRVAQRALADLDAKPTD